MHKHKCAKCELTYQCSARLTPYGCPWYAGCCLKCEPLPVGSTTRRDLSVAAS